MTLVQAPPAQAQSEPAVTRPRAPRSATHQVVSTALLIFAATLLGFGVYLGYLSDLRYDRAQLTSYADFRVQLAQAIAPVGPTVAGDPRALLPLGTPVAVLAIPRLGLRDVVFEGTTGAVLQSGPGHLRDSVLPGQAGIAEVMGRAATYGGPFGRLSELNPGDTITVTTGQGVSRFRVLDVRRAGDPEPPVLAGGRGRLELVTADGPAFLPAGVLRVDADQVTPVQPAAGLVLTHATLPAAENPLAGDPNAWFPLVLWGQGLVAAAVLVTWARTRWGRWQIWIVAVPVLGFFGLAVANQASDLLLNLM
jgi:LPXTG-site transpeptidase (sortase) family protein